VAAIEQRPAAPEEAFWTLDDLEARAKRALHPAIYDYFAGGSEDEATLRANREAYAGWRFRYRVLAATGQPDLSTEILGHRVALPVQLAPTATQCLAHPDGELAAAKAAAEAGVIYCLSTLSTMSIEEVARAGGARWFQLYVYEDRGVNAELVRRAVTAGYSGIILTVDAPVLGRRERDFRNGFTLPVGVGYQNLSAGLSTTADATTGESGLANYFHGQMKAALEAADLEWLCADCSVPVLVKGVVRGDDARRCVDSGAAGVIVSNHGGRQLDYSIATLDALPDVVHAVGDRVPVLVDGGVRRGTDVLKALCLGARSVLIGRPLLWALANGGEDGVRQLFVRLGEELATSMTLLGANRLSDLNPDFLVRAK
jgi:4-hydroxymandelate oxidase